MLARSRWFIVLSFVLAVSGVAHAAALTTAACLACHNVMPKELVDAKLFQSSVHSALGCTACHSDVKAFPHTPAPKEVACGTCHGGIEVDYSQSVHATFWGKEKKLNYPACLECHGNAHAILAKTDAKSPVYPLNLPRTCGRCHGSPEMARRYGITNVYELYIGSIHGFALTQDGLLVAASCASCHGAHRILSTNDPQSRTYRTNVPATCGSCHAGIEALYFEGVHGKALKAGSATAAVCTDCHTVHQIARVQTGGLADQDGRNMRQLPQGAAAQLPGYFPWSGDRARVRGDRALLELSRKPPGSAPVGSQVFDCATESGSYLWQLPSGCYHRLYHFRASPQSA